MNSTLDIGVILDIVTIVVAVSAAWILVRSKVCQQTERELRGLADARKEKIEEQGERINKLEKHVSQLEGKLDGLALVKAEQIADLVVTKLEQRDGNGR